MSNQQLRLNGEAEQFLAQRVKHPHFKQRYALVFMGDTHIGKQCKNDIDSSLMYTRLLKSILRNQEQEGDILAIIHGGDGTHRGEKHLEEFVHITRQTLSWDIPDADHIPLFMNLGNHEYFDDPSGEQYGRWIADPAPLQRIWLDDIRWGVILLNTGMQDRGYLPDNQFSEALTTIEQEIAHHRGYRVVIDMHIPPSLGRQAFRYLALNYSYTREFKQLLKHYPKTIAAVASHHRHWAQMTAQPYRWEGRTPLYISAYGGHCDCPRFSCLKLSFYRQPGGQWGMKSQLLYL